MQDIFKLLEAQEFSEAEKALLEVLAKRPTEDMAHFLLGSVYQIQGRPKKALNAYLSIQDKHQFEPAYTQQLGLSYFGSRYYLKANEVFLRICKQDPTNREALTHLGDIAYLRRHYKLAAEYYNKLPVEELRNSVRVVRLARSMMALGSESIALKLVTSYLNVIPDDPSVYPDLVYVYVMSKRFQKASEIIKLWEKVGDSVLLNAYKMMCDISMGRGARALRLADSVVEDTQDIVYEWLRDFMVPANYSSLEEMTFFRDHYQNSLNKWKDRHISESEYQKVNPVAHFHLSYQGVNVKEIFSQTALLIPMTYTPQVRKSSRPKKRQVGIVSEHLRRHSVTFSHGEIFKNTPEDMDIHMFLLASEVDEVGKALRDSAASFTIVKPNLADCQKALSKHRFDIMLFPEIGMSNPVYLLANSRWAPVQFTTLGHPVTSGLPSVDYYLGASLFEPKNAQDYYTETLVTMDGMPFDYQPVSLPKQLKSRSELGLPETQTIYYCPMMLMKIHPSFDTVIHNILKKDPRGVIIMVKYRGIEEVLQDRFKRQFSEDITNRILFHEPFEFDDYLCALHHSDVVLETVPFGGVNTVLQAFSVGTPVITMPQPQASGRFGYGLYTHIGILDPVASSLEDYANKAVTIATDKVMRARLSKRILEAHPKLFNVHSASEVFWETVRSFKPKV